MAKKRLNQSDRSESSPLREYFFDTPIGNVGILAQTRKKALKICEHVVIELSQLRYEYDSQVLMVYKKYPVINLETMRLYQELDG